MSDLKSPVSPASEDEDGPQPGNMLMPGEQPRRAVSPEEEDGPQPGNEKFPPPKAAAPERVERPLESMETLLAENEAQATPRSKEPKVGALVKGTVVKLGSDAAFIDIGAKSEAVLDLGPLRDETGKPAIAEGDIIEAHVVSVGGKGGAIVLSKALVSGPELRGMLGQAMDTGLPVEGLVTAVNKGGLEVSVGGMRAFCPSSQIDLRFVETPAQFIGKKLRFKVTKIDDGGRNIVLSRRALLEEENAGQAAQLREKLVIGAVLRGSVTSIRDYGAFIDLGAGIEGLLHVSEISFGHVGHPSQVLTVGQEVEVQVLKIESAAAAAAEPAGGAKAEGGKEGGKSKHKRPPKEQKISLSLKTLVEDPWSKVAEKFPIGAKIKGKVVRLQPFGAFVELAPGLDGLIHVSQLADKRIMHPKDVVKPGQEVEVTVIAVEPDKKRIGLTMLEGAAREAAMASPPGGGEPRGERSGGSGGGGGGGGTDRPREPRPPREDAGAKFKPGDIVVGKVQKIEAFGVFIQLEGGARALIPNVEMGTPRGADHKKLFPEGTEIRGVILPGEKGKLRMSKKGAEEADERKDAQEWNASQNKAAGGASSSSGPSFGTFGDLLKKFKK